MTPRSIWTRFSLHSGLLVILLSAQASAAFAQDIIALLRNRAAHGDMEAENELGVRYSGGIGVKQDDFEAVRWYRFAAERGHPGAQNALGKIYSKGIPGLVTRDDPQAERWFRRAAEQGNAEAQFNLGNLHAMRKSSGDLVLAQMWYSLAASQGHAPAVKQRNRHARSLGAGQLSEALELTRKCTDQKFRDCGR